MTRISDKTAMKISALRHSGKSYSEVAHQLLLSVNTVKTYCRRNGLQSFMVGETYKPSARKEPDHWIKEACAFNADMESHRRAVKKGEKTPACEITFCFAEKDDPTVVADIMTILYTSGRS